MHPTGGGPARGAILLALGAALLTSCGSGDVTALDAGEAVPVDADYYASEYGVRVGISARYAVARDVTGARLVGGGDSVDAELDAVDGTDPDSGTTHVVLAPGDPVLVEGTLQPSCAGEREAPAFEVLSDGEGGPRTDRFVPANGAGYDRAVDEWCARPVTMTLTGSRATPGGDYELRVEFSNPGPDPVTVTSERVDDGTSRWEEASVVVPAGLTPLTIRGHGPPECAVTPPWETGHVRLDGEVIRPAIDEWC